jgi:hypothetical protein
VEGATDDGVIVQGVAMVASCFFVFVGVVGGQVVGGVCESAWATSLMDGRCVG